jgi:hypothetical protein
MRRTPAPPVDVPGVARIEPGDQQTYTLYLDGASSQDILTVLVNRRVEIDSFEVGTAPLEEIFIDAVKSR